VLPFAAPGGGRLRKKSYRKKRETVALQGARQKPMAEVEILEKEGGRASGGKRGGGGGGGYAFGGKREKKSSRSWGGRRAQVKGKKWMNRQVLKKILQKNQKGKN